MVGVAGRSKACKNCRQRRVKCDEVRPTCKRCTKARLTCGGWPSLTVIQYDGRISKQRTPDPRTEVKEGESSDQIVTILTSTPRRAQTLTEEIVRDDLSLFNVSPWVKVAISADDIFVNYTLAHLLNGNEEAEQTGWILDRALSDQCFLALATSYFGNEQQEKAVLERGLQRYGSALGDLNHALSDLEKRRTYDILEAVILMSLFEFLMSDNFDGWIGHSLGLERLLTIRGPQSIRTPPERVIFQKARPGIILAAIVLHKTTMLAETGWKTIPWQDDPQSKQPFQFLIDILADCPELFVIKDRMYATLEPADQRRLACELQQRVECLMMHLDAWKSSYEIVEPAHSYEVRVVKDAPLPRFRSSARTPPWSSNIRFRTLAHANAIVMYHAITIMLLKIVHELTYNYDVDHAGFTNLPSKMYTAGIEICRSVDYHLESIRNGLGSFILVFPLRMAWDAVGQSEPAIGKWLTDVLQKIQSGATGRWAVAGYVLKINTPDFNSKTMV